MLYVGSIFAITAPIFLFFIALATCLLPSQPGTNSYGPNPTEATS